MTFSEYYRAAEMHFQGWLDQLLDKAPPVRWENIAFQYDKSEPLWLGFHIIEGEGQQITVGPEARHRWRGTLQVSFSAQQGIGTREIMAWVDSVANLYQRQVINLSEEEQIRYLTPIIDTIGLNEEEAWQINLSIEYEREGAYDNPDAYTLPPSP